VFVQKRVNRTLGRQHPVLLTAHPANGNQQPQLAVDSLAVAHVAEAKEPGRTAQVTKAGKHLKFVSTFFFSSALEQPLHHYREQQREHEHECHRREFLQITFSFFPSSANPQ
jgi:hypothetical protein